MTKWILIAITAIAVAVFSYYQYYVYVQTFRFRMTMTVSTPDGPKSASSVIAVFFPRDMRTVGATGIVQSTAYGVAPIVDLGRYGTLIAALDSWKGDPEAERLSPTGTVEGNARAGIILNEYGIPSADIDLSKAWNGGKRVLIPDLYPQIVWVPPGVTDPNRARAFHPLSLPEVIGADVRIVSITIEPTHDPLIERVPNASGWLEKMRQRENGDTQIRWYPRSDRFPFYLGAVETQRPTGGQ